MNAKERRCMFDANKIEVDNDNKTPLKKNEISPFLKAVMYGVVRG